MKERIKLIKLLFLLYVCGYDENMISIWNGIIYQKRKILKIKDKEAVG